MNRDSTQFATQAMTEAMRYKTQTHALQTKLDTANARITELEAQLRQATQERDAARQCLDMLVRNSANK